MQNLNYGVIGNCTTAALVSERGSIDWLCFPRFDSSSVFARLLDKEKGGSFGFKVPDDYKITQKYIPHTNLLATTFESDEGTFVVTDFMPRYKKKDGYGYYRASEIYRYIHLIRGNPKIKVIYQPRPDYARGRTLYNITEEYIETMSSSNIRDRQYLYSSLTLQYIAEGIEFTLKKDEFMLLSYNQKVIKVDLDREKLDYCRTLVYWLDWSENARKYQIYGETIERSMLTLKMMSFTNGAMLAAITTSIPEVVGEVRNWDYRFCWLRDASMSINTLINMGHPNAARSFINFIKSTFIGNHSDFQIMYGINGERTLKEKTLDHLTGYRDSKPVRIGNDAYRQKQNDSFGYLMDLIYQYFCFISGSLDEIEDAWDMVKNIMRIVMKEWHKPDKGIWEIRGEEQHFISSKVMCWVALDRGSKIAAKLGCHINEQRWRKEADIIRQEVFNLGWKENINSFSQTYDNEVLDASLLLMEPYGFTDANDIRYQNTVKAVKENLMYNGLMFRYKSSDDFGIPKSSFTICNFWLIHALFVIGNKEEARCLFENMISYSNHLGLLSEDIDFESKEQLGNFPQAYSHLALIDTAILFSEEEKKYGLNIDNCKH
jgi:alpha,alpha-trehalase